MNLVLLIPVYNDWASVVTLIRETDDALARASRRARVLIVDDGSSESATDPLWQLTTVAITALDVLHLRCNVGHQRAIAIGLAYVEANVPSDVVVVLDGDGEDRPDDIDRLLKELERSGGRSVVFAERTRRSEGLFFTTAYWLYRVVHRVLVGERVRVGNFAAVPASSLARLVAVSALWNHFAAAVFQARVPYTMVPTSRGTRYDGSSHMSTVALVTHGLSAMSVFGDRIGVRLLVAVSFFLLVVIVPGAVGIALNVIGNAPLPAWAPYGALMVVIAMQTLSIALVFVFIVLAGRGALGFVPLRDYVHYVLKLSTVPLKSSDVAAAIRRH